jgi:protein-S-isoprenylcysteine O-methyltransferase Ste14
MTDKADNAQVLVRPPIALLIGIAAGVALDWFVPLPWLSVDFPAGWIGWGVFGLGFALLVWAAATIRMAGSNVPTNQPTTAIVEEGPYRFSRNPIYVAMFVALIGLAIALNTLWLLVMLVPFALVIRYGVVAREEKYLDRKFGDSYRSYRSRVRRWF